jgi:DNA-binding MarR family transcriptional regulator
MSKDYDRYFEILGLLRRNQVLTDMLDEAAAAYLGINRTDARALDVIDQHGRIAAGDLARELRLSPGAVTTIVDRLERAGYARRVPDPDDRRRVLIETTPVVAEKSALIYGSPEENFAAVASDYTDEEADVLLRFQQMSQNWLEERLERVASLTAERGSTSRDSGA